LGEEHTETSKRSITTYYAFLGERVVAFAESVPRTPEAIMERQRQFAEGGVDELIWDPTVPDLDQVDRLADVVLAT
jgi:hypothetical protein